jgi:acyl-CoA synthetase
VIADVIPRHVRLEWAAAGYYYGQDLYTAFASIATTQPEHVAIVDESGHTTFDRLLSVTERVASRFVDSGMDSGDIVGLRLAPCWESCAIQLAIAATGAVCLPYSDTEPTASTTSLLRQAGASAAVLCDLSRDFDESETLAAHREGLPNDAPIFIGRGASHDSLSLELDLLAGRPRTILPQPHDPDSPCLISTSQTPKGARQLSIFSHNSLGRPHLLMLLAAGLSERSRFLSLDATGMEVARLGVPGVLAAIGATLIVVRDLEYPITMEAINTLAPTHLRGTPQTVNMLLAEASPRALRSSSVQAVWVPSPTVPPSALRALQQATGWEVTTAWERPEGAWCGGKLADREPGPVGPPRREITDVRVMDARGHDAPVGEKGQIWARGPLSAMGCLNAPRLTEECWTPDGWLRTNEIGLRYSDGRIKITGHARSPRA